MPVVTGLQPFLEPGAGARDTMGIVEAYQSPAIGRMQGKRV